MNKILEIMDLQVSYGFVRALQGISLYIDEGEIVTMIGANGAGKSTLMQVLAGKDIQSGERILGHNAVVDYFAQNQSASLDDERTVYEELLADARVVAHARRHLFHIGAEGLADIGDLVDERYLGGEQRVRRVLPRADDLQPAHHVVGRLRVQLARADRSPLAEAPPALPSRARGGGVQPGGQDPGKKAE